MGARFDAAETQQFFLDLSFSGLYDQDEEQPNCQKFIAPLYRSIKLWPSACLLQGDSGVKRASSPLIRAKERGRLLWEE